MISNKIKERLFPVEYNVYHSNNLKFRMSVMLPVKYTIFPFECNAKMYINYISV